MTEVSGIGPRAKAGQLRALLAGKSGLIRDYLAAISGSAGRLVFSLVYFLALANALSLADFGLFATASAAGVMLSRLLAFGFISPLYRTATIRPRLIGVYTGGFLLLGLASLPLIALAAYAMYWIFFPATLPITIFAVIVTAEAFVGRPFEAVIIVNNGLGRFATGSFLTIFGVAMRTIAAVALYFSAQRSLELWSYYLLAATVVSLIFAAMLFYPRQRIRFVPKLYWRKMHDAISVAGAEVLFYLQMEFDKLLVLAFGGAHIAGVYAVIMRLVDLTAIPIRTFNMMLVQKLMRTPQLMARLKTRVLVEAGLFTISTLAVLGLSAILYFNPRQLGATVAQATPLLILAFLVPGLRNLVEYQGELLYARGQTYVRAVILAVLGALKALLLIALLKATTEPTEIIAWLNAAFLALYLVSAVLTYRALGKPAKPV